MIKRFLCAVAAVAVMSLPNVANADFPEKTITLVVPSTAGSQPSTLAQIVGEAMQDALG